MIALLLASGCGPHEVRLERVEDVPLPGRETRLDYQAVDAEARQLVIAHMNDGTVLVVGLDDHAVRAEVPNVPTARGVAVADEIGKILVTASPDQLVLVDRATLTEAGRVTTGRAPDGVGWDGPDRVVGVSDQGEGALTLLADGGQGARIDVPLGDETGNVVYDDTRGWFWIAVVGPSEPDRLVAVDPAGARQAEVALPGCVDAHGVRLHPDGATAYVACEGNDRIARAPLAAGGPALVLAGTGGGPDVLAIDPDEGLLYVAAESGDVAIFDLSRPGLRQLGTEHVGPNAHSVAVDPSTHLAYFPLEQGPALRIMRPVRR